MSAVSCLSLRKAAVFAALCPATLAAQQPQAAAANPNTGMLTPISTNAEAVSEWRASLKDWFDFAGGSASRRAARALELDSKFPAARAMKAFWTGGAAAAAESQRAVSEAGEAPATEALLALGMREWNAGRAPNARRVLTLAAELAPNDRDLALVRAIFLADTARIAAVRALTVKYPDFVGAKNYLAVYLAPWGITVDSVAKANEAEALAVAGDAVRLAPKSSASHVAMGHVLHALGRDVEAREHLLAATSLEPRSAYAYQLLADIYARDGNIPQMRAAFDSAIALGVAVGQRFADRRARAATYLAMGNAQQALADLGEQLRDAEAAKERPQLGPTHLWAAIMSAGSGDSAGAEKHIAAARTFEPGPVILADNEVIVYSLIGNAREARRALNDYLRAVNAQQDLSPQALVNRTQNIHRLTGLTLLAERKPKEAIVELRQGGPNPWVTVGIIEAHKALKQNRQADAARRDLFARREFTAASSAVPIIRYRSRN